MPSFLFIIYTLGSICVMVDGKLFDACFVIYRHNAALAKGLFLLFVVIWPITLVLFLFRKK